MFSDPTVIHGRQSQDPLIWNDEAFASHPALWRDAQDHGIRTGWAQSSLKNSIKKLNSPNKTAAVARAVLLGWLR